MQQIHVKKRRFLVTFSRETSPKRDKNGGERRPARFARALTPLKQERTSA